MIIILRHFGRRSFKHFHLHSECNLSKCLDQAL